MPYIIVVLLLIAPGFMPSTRVAQEPAPPSAQQSPAQSPAEPAPQSQPSEQPKEKSKRPTPSTGKRESNPPPEKPAQNAQAPESKQTTPEPTVTKPEAPKTEAVPATAPEKPEKKTSSDWWIVYLTGALVFVGLCQVTAMGVQTYWMIRTVGVAKESAEAATATVRTMQDTAEKQLRAYVYVVRASRAVDETGTMMTHLEIKNAGQTPAYECTRYYVEAVSSAYPPPADDFSKIPVEVPEVKSPIPPGETVEFHDRSEPLTSRQEAQILLKNAAIFVFGKITYRDAFGHEQVTNFRFECTGELLNRGLFAPSKGGNEAT